MPDQPARGGLDNAFAELLAQPRISLRRPPPGLALADLRQAANGFLAQARGPELFLISDHVVIGGETPIPLRLYRPTAAATLPLVVFLHGGGFVLGDLDSHDATCRHLAAATGMAVAAPAYRLAPEHPFPTPLDDVMAALLWLRRDATELGLAVSRWAVAGDSAGAQLALAASLRAEAEGFAPAFAALLYPLIDPSRASDSARAFDEGHMLTGSFVAWAWECYLGGARDDEPLYDLRRADLARLPPLRVVTAEFDPLRDEGEAFSRAAAAAGVPVSLRRYAGVIHGFAGFPQLTPKAVDAIEYLAEGICSALA